MEIVNRVSRMAAITAKTLVTDVKVGLVPTLGAINPAHLTLIRTARKMADLAIVSMFANRLEFSSQEEYERYPRDITADADLLRGENIDFLFIPPEEEMYPPNFSTYVDVQKLGSETGLPQGLLRGMATGALKILHLTKPAYSFYGEPDALQAATLRKMIRDFNISTDVLIAPVEREPSGLAYSGRNRLLTEIQLAAAPVFNRSLRAAQEAIESGETHVKRIVAEITRVVAAEPLAKLEYAVIVDPELLEPVPRIQGTVIIAIGGKIGNVFLGDAVLVNKNAKSAA